jgi:hypothetical protein
MSTKSSRERLFILVTILGVALLTEALCGIATRIISRRGWMAYIPSFTQEKRAEFLVYLDPHFGWGLHPNENRELASLKNAHDVTISGKSCVSAYGGSYTEGLPREQSYPYQMGQILRCPVANFGIGGYGSDQALLRYRAQHRIDPSRVILLAHASEGILPILNQYRNLLYPTSEGVFKPRFIMEKGELKLIPPPITKAEDFDALERSPSRMLTHDEFLSRPRPEFPYVWSLTRWFFTDYHVRAKLSRVPRYAQFYEPSHPAGGVQLLGKIFETFHSEVTRDGKVPLLAIVPTCHDFLYFKSSGKWVEAPIVELMKSKNIDVVQVGAAMEARRGSLPAESLYVSCNGHPNQAGYKMIAEILADALRRRAKFN